MKIKALDVYPLAEPWSGRRYVLVKLTAEDGTTGWGEAAHGGDAGPARKAVVGEEASRYDYVTRQLAGDAYAGAVNMAMLDLYGKVAKAPVFQLLGGPTRNKVRAMTPYLGDWQAEAGHRSFVLPVRRPAGIVARPALVDGVKKQIEEWRQRLGPKVDFVADGLGLLPSAEAADLAVALEPYHPLWFDRPTREPNGEVLGRIAEESTTPIGLGHEMGEIGGMQNLLRDGLVDVVRLPLGVLGVTPIRRAAALAETYYVAVAPVHGGGPVGTAAALHLAASLPNFFIQEIPAVEKGEGQKMRAEMVGGEIEKVTAGYLALSTKPGLGIAVNEALVRRMVA